MSVPSRLNLSSLLNHVSQIDPLRFTGEVTEMSGLLIKSKGPHAAIGQVCEIETRDHGRIPVQVVGFRDGYVLTMPLQEVEGLVAGNTITARPSASSVRVGPGLLGRVLDGFGNPMDGLPPIESEAQYPLQAAPPNPLERRHITEQLTTGIRTIDGLLPIGKGQRVGIFGGSGVGKSVLLGSLAKNSSAQVTVVGLIGERNREVREFIDHELGPEGLKRSVVVVATSDRPAPLRVRAAFTVTAIAEYFRDQGKDVLLIVDSVTRLAMAQREIGLASGEPPSQKGYTPSVFATLPRVFERAGNFTKGSITGIYTVLVEGDDFNEPIADATRSILDGHVILSRKLGSMGHYPAIDVLNSISRLASKVASASDKEASQKVREAMATYQNSEDLIQLGAYLAGSNPKLDVTIRTMPHIQQFLRQDSDRTVELSETAAHLENLALQLKMETFPEPVRK
ncbi:MAG: FliI/YscN family ATPase [Acidobacteriota bacterium]